MKKKSLLYAGCPQCFGKPFLSLKKISILNYTAKLRILWCLFKNIGALNSNKLKSICERIF